MSSQHTIEAVYATGHWLLESNRHADAAKVFRVMTLTKPDDERGWLALGACHEGIGQKRIASELYRIASSVAAPAIRCAIAQGRVLRSLDLDEQATEAFDNAYALALAEGENELAQIALIERSAS